MNLPVVVCVWAHVTYDENRLTVDSVLNEEIRKLLTQSQKKTVG